MIPELRAFVSLSLVAALMATSATGRTVQDRKLKFALELPEGFREAADVVGQGGIVHAFRGVTEDGVDTLITVRPLGGTIGRDGVSFQTLRKRGIDATRQTFVWAGHKVEGGRIREVLEAGPMTTINVQVPLAAEAIQLSVAAATKFEDSTIATTQALLDGLAGESSWDDDVRAQKIGAGAIKMALVALVMFGTLRYLLKRQRSPRRGKTRRRQM